MTNNSLSIHIESGDIFYQNFNTGENFYNFILSKYEDQTAPVPKRFSIDDVQKIDLYAHKNAKYLFYRFNGYIKTSSEKRQTIKHTIKVNNSIGLKKTEERDQQFLVEKIIHC